MVSAEESRNTFSHFTHFTVLLAEAESGTSQVQKASILDGFISSLRPSRKTPPIYNLTVAQGTRLSWLHLDSRVDKDS